MTEDETNLADRLRVYIETSRGITSTDERQVSFMDLVRDFVGLQPSDFIVNREIYAGQWYSVLGNLVVAFTGNLHWQIKEAEPRLRQYMTYLKSLAPKVDYFAIVTDGLHFHAYFPEYNESGEVVRLEKTFGLNLPSPLTTLEQATNDFGVILSPFRPN